ncbi:MAG: ComF family protein, partial [Magnetospirillum sp. WYHS-4]
SRARAAVAYGETSRKLLLAFKHGDRTDSAPALGQWLQRAGGDLLPQVDLIAPVPLHWTRLFLRRYNQAALLARELGRLSGLPVVPDLLVRKRRTASQGHLNPRQRKENLQGAFAVHPRRRAGLAGKRVLLVDDVLTTGATVAACARTLAKAGAASVDVLTLARVLRPLPD